MKETNYTEVRQRKPKKLSTFTDYEKYPVEKQNRSSDSLPNSSGYVLIILFLIIIKFFHVYENTLPPQLTLSDAKLHPGRFIGKRAELQLKRLTDLGTRVVGSYENEFLAVDFLKREISFIAQEAANIHKIEVDVQKPTGSYFLNLASGFRNYYANIQNVVVKLSSGESSNSVLLNCHYDTVPESPGASDNGLNCVVLLEILRVLSASKTPLKNNIIFLFNGAEENPLQASHGFLSQHKWSKEVKVLINLDSAGAGGKELLFQTSGESWLVDAYARSVPHPTAGVQGEEIFLFGIIPSDTDFRIFRTYANYSGFDLAHCFNGYIYHTKYDTMDYIQPGVYQNTGDNILELVKELVNSPELGKEHPASKLVYFDVFGLFVVHYTESFAKILNLFSVIISLYAIYSTIRIFPDFKLSIKNSIIAVGGQFLGLLLGAAVVFAVIKTLDSFKSTMSWYLRQWLIVPLYGFPFVLAIVAMLLLAQTQMKRDLPGHAVVRFTIGAQLFWTITLLGGTYLGIRSSFFITLVVLFPSIGILFITSSKKYFTVKKYLVSFMTCLIFPLMFILQQTVRIFTILIPMAARMGPHKNPEIIMGGLTVVVGAIILLQIIPILLLLRKLKSFLITLCVIHILAMVGVICTNYGFPYNGDPHNLALQRFYVFHTERTFYDAKGALIKQDSGFFVKSMDRNNINYVSQYVPELKLAQPSNYNCSTALYCGFPVFTGRFIKPAAYSYWIPAEPPTIHHPTSLEVLNQTQIAVNVRRIRLLVTGPDHITIGMAPMTNVELIKWSFDEFQPIESDEWNGRKTYMVYYSHGLMGGSLEFDVDIKMNQDNNEYMMDIVVIGHYMHDKKFQTNNFKKFLSKFPDWAHLTPWTNTYKSWKI